MAKEYVVYKGDELLAFGTAEEIAKQLDVTPATVRWWSTPSSIERGGENRKVAYLIED